MVRMGDLEHSGSKWSKIEQVIFLSVIFVKNAVYLI